MSKIYEKTRTLSKKYKDKLLPCKYCGNANIVIALDRESIPFINPDGKRDSRGTRYVWYVACSTRACDCGPSFSCVKKAVAAWNERQSASLL